MPIARRTYKDTLFRHLFGSEETRGNALELYNALGGTSHTDPSMIEFNTIDSFIYLGYANDVSFIIDDEMMLLEHQSTRNPNMPLRGLLYFAKLYTKYVAKHELDLYGSGKLHIPTPRFVVLYFGTEKRPDREVLALSELFSSGPGDIEVTATVLNCNEGRNTAIMDMSETLRGYAHLIALVRAYERGGVDLTEAVDAAIDECIAKGILATYLEDHREEARELLFTMEDEERAQAVHRKAIEREAREKGYREGYDLGRSDGYSAGRDAGYSAGRDEGIERGIEQGIEQGTEKERKRIRAALEAANVDPAIIEAYV